MATALRTKSFQKDLLMSIGGIFLLFAVSFSTYQYRREKDYKIDIMHSRLQMYNYEMMQTLGNAGITNDSLFNDYILGHKIPGLRITVVNTAGEVLMDSYHGHIAGNHSQREEIRQALKEGNGYDIKRTSESTHETYFYSATRFGNIVVRTAVPYSVELTRSLQADNTFIYFSVLLTLLLGAALYWSTHRISRHIGYLREFAVKAEDGTALDHELERKLPDDELGDISHTIITLYWKLRHAEEDKARIKHQLTQNAAHELKTPAASIHGYLESILDNPDMPKEKQQHFLERCFAQSERMNKLLLDMAQLTKLGESSPTNKARTQSETIHVDIKEIICNVLDHTSLQLQEKGIEVQASLPETIMVSSPLNGPEDVIYSIFRNLIDNAIAYATGATLIVMRCRSMKQGEREMYEFTVSDNGPGVAPEHLPHLFERFYRVDKGRSRKLGGTGLGLAIVKNAVVAHGGTVTAYTTPGNGLTIQFTLPT